MKYAVIPIADSMVYGNGTVKVKSMPQKIKTDDCSLGNEGYIIEAKPDAITIRAQTDAGFFYAEKTLEQLNICGEIPCVTVKDSPRFAYRGFMLDSARHMQSTDEIKKLVDAAAFFKLNTMHWHLSDDQGFRIESKKFPMLNEKGSWRESDDFGSVHTGERYGGFYTQDEIKEIVAYCKERFIEVVPEIDIPGHTTSIISSYPFLSCRKEQIPVQTKQGIFEDVICAGNEQTLEFVFELLDEIAPLFPGERFHIGGDEVKHSRWESCPKCRAKKEELGFESFAQLQGWYTAQIISHLKKLGKKATVWNESLAGDNLPGDTTVQMWLDPKKLSVRHANRGGKVICSDFYRYYCDYPYHMTPLKKAYNFNPVLKGVTPGTAKNIIGVEVPIWTEYISNFERLCYLFFPRFAAVAENGWSKTENLSCADFEKRFIALTPLIKQIGINPAPPSDWNPTPLERLCGTADFFRDKISLSTLLNSLSSQKN